LVQSAMNWRQRVEAHAHVALPVGIAGIGGGELARAWRRRSSAPLGRAAPWRPGPPLPPTGFGTTASVATYNAEEYNWSGFSCPYCNASSFVSCAGGHLVCDGTAELRNGHRFHQCFCGQAGSIRGTMKTLESRRLSAEAESSAPNTPVAESQRQSSGPADIALPPPTPAKPAKR
jgi:hypothetical protein